jgi:gliding motility-associated-like protein
LTGTAPNLTYTPNDNYNGPDSFTFKANDGTVDSNTATVTINVTPVNDAPVADDQAVTTDEDTQVSITLTASDTEGSALTWTIVAQPVHGTISGTAPNLSYTPGLNYNGSDSFTFKVNDGNLDSNIATVTITINAVNDVPVAANQNVTVTEDVAKGITLSATDVETAVLTYTVVTQPSNGTLTGTAPNLTYTPNDNYNGPDSFTFKANDGTIDSNTATVTINVTPVNDAPVADDQSVTTDEDTQVTITLTATDGDEDALTWTIVTQPAHGTLSGTAPDLTYTPGLNYNGSDSFTFTVNDGLLTSNTAIVTITVNPVNDAPVANAQSVTIAEDTFANITLTASDVDGDELTWTIVTQPANGTLTGTAPNVTFTPSANFNGSTSFTFKVNDGTVDSNTATVSITVTPVNDAPVASGQTVFTNEDTSTPLLLNATDRDGDPLTYAIVTPPVNGTLSCNNCRNPVYVPNTNYFGSDSFTFRANDGQVNSNTATVNISIASVNDAPIAQNQNVTVVEDTPKEIVLTATDVDNDVLTYTILTNPSNGTLSGTAPNLTYTPNADFFGTDQFTFRVNDGAGAVNSNSNIATVSITVTSVNDLPVANDDEATTPEDTPVTFSITSNDTDKDGVINPNTVDLNPATGSEEKTFTVTGEGTYSVSATGDVTFTPVLNWNGTATPVAYTVKDNQSGLSNQALIKVTVTAVNDNPLITVQTITTNEDEPKEVCFTYTDVEGSSVEFSYNGGEPTVFNPGETICFTYTPDLNFNGSDQIVISVCETGNPEVCGTAVFPVTVNPDNDKPVVIVDNQPVNKLVKTTLEDTVLDFCFDVSDVENDNITISEITNISGGGTLTETVGEAGERCLSFNPVENFFGTSTWTLQLCDDGSPSRCSTLTIEINVTEVNDLPVAQNISVSVPEDGQKTFSLGATDADNEPLTFQILTQPLNGKIVVTGGTVVYTPNFNYFGPDSFNYRVNDGRDDSNTATVSITVEPVNDPPLIQQIPITLIPEDTEGTVCVGVVELDGENLIYEVPTNVSGGGTITQDAEFPFCYNFRSAPNYNGDTFWKFKVCDASGLCSEVVFQIVVTPVNDAPVANDDELIVRSFEESDIINVLANDTDLENDQLTVTATPLTAPSHGTFTLSTSGALQYKSELGYIGQDQLTYEVCDNGTPRLCATATVNITVNPPQFRIFEGLSPNNDGLNDYWRLNGIEDYPTNRVRVFDRYNNLVYDMRNYDNESNNWRGQANVGVVNGNLPDGTYFYIVEINDGKGPYSGFIVLKRN